MFYQLGIFVTLLIFLTSSNTPCEVEIKGIDVQLPHEERMEKIKLLLSSSPSGAKVYINKNYEGITPLEKEMLPGRYEVKMTKWGYGAVIKDIYVEPGQALDKLFKLPSRWNAAVAGGAFVAITGIILAVIFILVES